MNFTIFIVSQLIFLEKLHLWFLDLQSFLHFIDLLTPIVRLFEAPHLFFHFDRVIDIDPQHVGLNLFLVWDLIRIKHDLKLVFIIILLLQIFSWGFFNLFYSVLDLVCGVDQLEIFHHICNHLVVLSALRLGDLSSLLGAFLALLQFLSLFLLFIIFLGARFFLLLLLSILFFRLLRLRKSLSLSLLGKLLSLSLFHIL